jgi:hypothetical protein
MQASRVASLLVGLGLATLGAAVAHAQSSHILPSYPKLAFGGTISPAYDGWYDNPDGTRTFLMGYYSRNWEDPIEVPIGPNNHFEPGPPDRGQPTNFMPNRNFGMFSVTLPKDNKEKLWWVLTVNGVTQRVPMSDTPDYNITPQHSSEEGPAGAGHPAVLRFTENGKSSSGSPAGERHSAGGDRRRADDHDFCGRAPERVECPTSGREPMVEMVVTIPRSGRHRGQGHHHLTD